MSGGIAGRGQPGKRGPPGPTGPAGPQGPAAFSLEVGSVTAVPYGGAPSVENVGTDQDQVWNIAVPTGATGVLTGDTPPTGSDGTSLGQLYYCTANQSYYSLIELNENDNKWRPIMTQESAIRTYDFDLIKSVPIEHADTRVLGRVSIMLDDVKQKLTASVDLRLKIAAGSTWQYDVRVWREGEQLERLRADCAQRGITDIPVPIKLTTNGVTEETTFGFLSKGWTILPDGTRGYAGVDEAMLTQVIPPTEPSGSSPGAVPVWEEGVVKMRINATGAPSATEYGQAIADPRYNTETWTILGHDTEYVVTCVMDSVVEVPYV